MSRDTDADGGLTRRDYLAYGGVTAAGGLLAGCSSGGDTDPAADSTEREDTPSQTATASPTGTEEPNGDATEAEGTDTPADTPYTVSVEPLGEFTFDRVPERYVALDLMAADIAHALGKPGLAAGPGDMNRWPTFFYDQLPGISFDKESALELYSGDSYDREVFYEADPDVNLIDPNMGLSYMGLSEAELGQLAEDTGPFVTPFNTYIYADWQEEHPTTIYEVFEQMSRVFREEEKYEAFATLHDEFIADVQSQLPPQGERPAVALINAGSDVENGEFYPSTIATTGTAMKPYRDLKLNDALADVEVTDGTFDYETMLEVDPEVIAVAWQIAVPDDEFEETFVDPFENDSIGQQLQAVQNGRVIKGQHLAQGPVINLFQTAYVAKQYYPDVFGEWPDDGEVPQEEQLFDRQRVVDIINGDL